MWIFIFGLLAVCLIFFVALYIVFNLIYRRNKSTLTDDLTMPEGEQYEPYCEGLRKSIERILPIPYEEVMIEAYDGLKLYGKYYENAEGAPLVIFFHGYRCGGIRDGNGIHYICGLQGYNILLVDQRAHGKSEGKVITFGIRERKDCQSWIQYALERFGTETRILLAGISMGAATVLMASELELPENVKGIMADCPYSSPKDILETVMKSMKLPVKLFYPMARFSAKILGRLDIEEASAKEAVKNSRVPILLIHGDDDRFVPCSMSQVCYDNCASEKKIVFVKDAGHGMSYCVDAKLYEKEAVSFMTSVLG